MERALRARRNHERSLPVTSVKRPGCNPKLAQDQRDAHAAHASSIGEAQIEYAKDMGTAAIFTDGQEADWRNHTRFDNSVAAQKAAAVVAFWSSQETATVATLQALDTVYNLPWTDFLVAQSIAHKDWWTTAPDRSTRSGSPPASHHARSMSNPDERPDDLDDESRSVRTCACFVPRLPPVALFRKPGTRPRFRARIRSRLAMGSREARSYARNRHMTKDEARMTYDAIAATCEFTHSATRPQVKAAIAAIDRAILQHMQPVAAP
jgi:hypothetical protein